MPSLPYPHEPFSCLSTLYMWVPEVHYEPPFSGPTIHWDNEITPSKQFDQSLKKWCGSSSVVLVSSGAHEWQQHTPPHNASGRKWICSFKWCMGVLLSCWTPFCGQEWSSLNYLPNGINSAERKLAELLSSFTLWQIHSKICFKRWTTHWLVFLSRRIPEGCLTWHI